MHLKHARSLVCRDLVARDGYECVNVVLVDVCHGRAAERGAQACDGRRLAGSYMADTNEVGRPMSLRRKRVTRLARRGEKFGQQRRPAYLVVEAIARI